MTDIRVDFGEIKGVEKSLKELDDSALPVAMRQTLNDLAFLTRKVTLPEEYHKAVVAKGSGKRLTKTRLFAVDKAEGFNADNMVAEMGAEKGFGNIAQGMATQQAGANITDRGYIPVEGARGGNRKTSTVKKSAYLSTVENNMINRRKVSRRVKRGTRKSRVIADLYMAHKLKKFFVGRNGRGRFGRDNIYMRTRKVKFSGEGEHRSGTDYKNNLVYVHKNKVINKPSWFLNKAGLSSLKSFEKLYQKNLEKQLVRVMRKHGL